MDKNNDIEIRENRSEEIEIDLLELFAYYLANIKVIIIGFLAGALLAGLITHFAITPMYTATSKMYMVSSSSQSVIDLTDLNIGQSISEDYVELLKTRPIVEGVIEDLGLDYTYNQLLGMMSLSIINNTRIIKIDVTSADNKEAMNIANALAEKGVTELPKVMETPEPHIAEYAIVPVNKSSPSLTKNTMIGALLAMLLVLAIFTIQYLLDDTFKTAEQIEHEFGVMPLTVIPEGKIEGLEPDESENQRQRRRKRDVLLDRKKKKKKGK